MSTNKEVFSQKIAERVAARQLLSDFIVNNPNKIVDVLGYLVSFYYECSQNGVKNAMNTVNVTFASVALDVVKTANLDDGEDGKRYLPIDANQMKSAIFYLSKLINILDPLSALIENNKELPAFKLSRDAYLEGEDLG